MSVVHNPRNTPLNNARAVDCHPAHLVTHTSDGATVVVVTGDIDALNAEPVSQCLCRFVVPGRTLIVDLSDLNFLAVEGLLPLFAVHDKCTRAGVNWTLVAGHPVRRLLRVADPARRLPAVNSMVAVFEQHDTVSRDHRTLRVVGSAAAAV